MCNDLGMKRSTYFPRQHQVPPAGPVVAALVTAAVLLAVLLLVYAEAAW